MDQQFRGSTLNSLDFALYILIVCGVVEPADSISIAVEFVAQKDHRVSFAYSFDSCILVPLVFYKRILVIVH